MFLNEYMGTMAEPQRKKIKLSLKKELKKERKDEMHQWANAYESNALDTHDKTKPVHVTKALMNRELTGKLPQKGVEMGMYKQRIKPQKRKLKQLEDKLKRDPYKKLSYYRDPE